MHLLRPSVRKALTLTASSLALTFGLSLASATVTISTTPTDFNLTPLSFPDTTRGTGNIHSLDGYATLVPSLAGDPQTRFHRYENFSPLMPGSEYVMDGDENFNVQFASPVTTFAFDYLDTSIASTFTLTFFVTTPAFPQVGSASFTTSNFNSILFIAFVSDIPFNFVRVRENDGPANTDEFFQFYAATPIPETHTLPALAIAALLTLPRRR